MMIWGTKGQTLAYLQDKLTGAKVLPLKIVTRAEFLADVKAVARSIAESFSGGRTIVRSSSTQEDTLNVSNAGKFESVLNVNSQDEAAVISAVEQVFASYANEDMAEEVLIQPMLNDECLSMGGRRFN